MAEKWPNLLIYEGNRHVKVSYGLAFKVYKILERLCKGEEAFYADLMLIFGHFLQKIAFSREK